MQTVGGMTLLAWLEFFVIGVALVVASTFMVRVHHGNFKRRSRMSPDERVAEDRQAESDLNNS